jgi:hypothetical protein
MNTRMRIHVFSKCLVTLVAPLLAASALAADVNKLSEKEKAEGWKLLFDGKTTEGWRGYKKDAMPATGWQVEDGWLHCLGKGGGDIVSDQQFDQFELQWEWKIAPNGNSGVKYFVTESRKGGAIGHEYQMIDDKRNGDAQQADGKRVTASFYDVMKPTIEPKVNPPGEINRSRIVVKGNHVEHWINGVKVLEYDCGSEATKAAVQESKFKTTQGFGDRVKAHLLLQDHHSEVWFRDIKVRDLSGK